VKKSVILLKMAKMGVEKAVQSVILFKKAQMAVENWKIGDIIKNVTNVGSKIGKR
jgi:hypothetical protein